MFTQQKLLFQFTKAIALVILLCFTFSYQAQAEKAVQEKAKDVAEITPQIEYDYEKEFEKEVKKKLAALKQEFKKAKPIKKDKPKFDKMADLLGDNTVLATPQGERLKGKDSLGRFWRKEKERGVTDVDFTLKYHYAIKVADPIEQPDKLDTIVHVGHAIIEYDLKSPKEGGTLTNKTGTLTLSLRHPRRCVWQE